MALSEGILRFRAQKPLLDRHRDFLRSLTWTGRRKDFLSLMREVRGGETTFFETPEGEIRRKLGTANVFVYYNHPKLGRLELVEDQQVFFKHGEVDHIDSRGNNFVAEKLVGDEDPREGAKRGLREELPMPLAVDRFIPVREETFVQGEDDSTGYMPSYPLLTTNKLYFFAVELRRDEYQEAYMEDQTYDHGREGKKTYFSWRKVSESSTAQ